MVDAPLDYNILPGRNWIYNMQAVALSLFWVVCFPLDGNIVMIHQISFDNSTSKVSSGTSIPFIDHSYPVTENVGVGMHPSLMGTFSYVVLVLMNGSIHGNASMSLSLVPFHTSNMDDPWTLPYSTTLGDSIPTNTDMPLSRTIMAYQDHLDLILDSSPSSSQMEEDPYAFTT